MTTNTQPQTQQSGGDELRKQIDKIFLGDISELELDDVVQLIQAREREAEQRGRIDEREKCTDETSPMYRSTIRGTNAIDGSKLSDEDRGWNNGTLHVLKMVDEKHQERIQQLQPKPQAGEGGEEYSDNA